MTLHTPIDSDFGAQAEPLDRWQYRLTLRPHSGAQAIGAYWLSTGPGLPVFEVTAGSENIGVLLGFPIDLAAQRLVQDAWSAPEHAQPGSDGHIHLILRRLGGRYLFILSQDERPRIYPDAVTGVSCVWDRAAKTAGSTADAILSDADYHRRFDHALYRRLQIDGEGWFPAGFTAHHGVTRLLPHHYLDLTSWTAHRFAAVPSGTPSPAEVIDGLVTTIRTQTRALLRGPKGVAIALTAGRDSRAILACLHDMRDDLLAVTVTGGDRHQTDTVVAKDLAARFGLRHHTLPRRTASKFDQDQFVRRGGHCYGDSNKVFHPSVQPLVPDYVFAGGLGGEVARAFYWSEIDDPAMSITPACLMTRFGLRRSDKIEAALQDWLDALPDMSDARDILDLAYIEQRFGPWAMAQFCADPTLERFSPMITYDSIQLMRDLPHEWKVQDRLNEAIVDRAWPALNAYPYNTLGPWKDQWIRLQRVAANPNILTKKVRQWRGTI